MPVRFMIIAALCALAAGCPGGPETPLPCEVDRVLEDKCRLCHGDPVEFGAPYALISWEDTQRTVQSQRVWERMQQRVHDASSPMPPRGVAQLTPEELAALDAWFAVDAPPLADDATCP